MGSKEETDFKPRVIDLTTSCDCQQQKVLSWKKGS